MKKYTIPHIRLSGTSFLLHADYVPAVRFTAERCEDIALLLIQAGDHGEMLASPEDIREIGKICADEGASLHVHLPTDMDFGTEKRARDTVRKVRIAVERAAPLAPHSFVLHVVPITLSGAVTGFGVQPNLLPSEQEQWIAEALRDIAAALPAPEMLAIENLETFQPAFWDRWLDNTPYSRCLDAGHIWKDGSDPAPILAQWLPRIRVIHLHGLAPRQGDLVPAYRQAPVPGQRIPEFARLFGPHPRDHKALTLMPEQYIDAFMHRLWAKNFAGTLVIEVFDCAEFAASHEVLKKSWERFEMAKTGQNGR